jgi:arylsulfatase A-like enzyme
LEDGHGQSTYDFTSNVPFLIDGPDVIDHRVSEQVRQIDIFPTLLDLLDVTYDATAIDGESLVPLSDIEDRVAYIRGCGESLRDETNWMRSVRVDDYKYIDFPNRDNWEPECYNVDNDSWELHPLSEFDRERFEQEFPFSDLGATDTIDIDERLRDLGYL